MSATGSGRVVLVTGAASGIGAAIAARFARAGDTVAVCDVAVEAAAAHAERLCADGGTARAYDLDVSSRQAWAEAVARIQEELGVPQVLVSNAGVTRDRTLLKMTDAEWDVVLDVHLRGTWLGCQHVVQAMRAAEVGGAIVTISSDGRHGSFGQANYSAAKAGIVGLTRTVALEHARHGIRANAVAPGAVETPMLAATPASVRSGWLEQIPLQRFAQPEEIASVVAFLASDDAAYMTGQVLSVDGGSGW